MTRPDLVSESIRLREQATKIRASMGKVLLELIAARAVAQRALARGKTGPAHADEVSARPTDGWRSRRSDS
jgi:hypothetical protein